MPARPLFRILCVLAAAAVWLAACLPPTISGTPTTAAHTATPEAISTRMMALLGPAVLSLDDGCLRAGEHALVWPPEFTVAVTGSRVEVTDGLTGEQATWQLGDEVWLAGGNIGLANINAEAGQYWYGSCATGGPYWLVGGINVPIAATATPPATTPATATPTATVPPATDTQAPSTATATVSSATASATVAPPSATSTTPPSTAVSAATATATVASTPTPTACAYAWFMPNPPAGCPGHAAVYAQTIAQRFERGLLLWRAQPDEYGSQIYAFFDDHQWPAWNPTNDRWRPGDPESDPSLVPPPGLYQPVRGFGAFWREAYFNPAGSARDRLGWAVEPEYAVGERALQCREPGNWPAGCFIGGPGDLVFYVEGNNNWSVWTGPAQ